MIVAKIYLGLSIFFFTGSFVMFTTIFDKGTDIASAISGAIFYCIFGVIFLFLRNKTKLKYNGKNFNLKNIFPIFSKEWRLERKIEKIEFENSIKNQFQDLNVLTTSAIANMLSETRDKYNKAATFNKELEEIDISIILFEFCKDSFTVDDIYMLKNLYNNSYYKRKITKYLSKLENTIKNQIARSMPSSQYARVIEVYNKYLDIASDVVKHGANIKFYRSVSTDGNIENLREAEDIFEDVDYKYRYLLIYLVDILQTCTCISKILFLERKINELSENSEFYKIIYNMTKNIKDIDLIINKTKPIYDELYKSELGFINDELLYHVGITIIVNKIKQKPISTRDKLILDINENYLTFITDIDLWIDRLAKTKPTLEIEKYLLFKIKLTIQNDFELLIKCLGMYNTWVNFYYEQIAYYKRKSDKERYLVGDFEKEIKEQSAKYSLNNITTGEQFEQYLENIFKDLGYKVKLNGKSGDQGAEALAKANNVILIDGKELKTLVDHVFDVDKEIDILQKF